MSTRRDLIYRMTADPEGFKKGMREAGRDSNLFWKELKKLEQQQKAVDEVMTTSGTAMLGFGAAVGIGLAAATKAAIDWESAWTGVAKVVDGTPEQLGALEGELRDLATTLPQTHAEIAGVAAAAGQLGIAREDIAEFTRTMVAMGVSTDLASEDAAMAMARLMNIMQSAPGEVDNLGSAIVGLGNAGASTESEIVDMALRIAGAGHTVGMTEAEVLGFASALASVGIEAESGGSSISTAMIKISEAVNEGGDSLQGFADVAGVTADEFASKFQSDPAAAIDLFVQGLGRMQSSGQDVFATLDTLGLSEIRLRDALLRLAGAGTLLTDSLATGNEAWRENSALMDEAARRYGTTEAQIQIARNQITDMGISLGENLLPTIRSFLDAGQGMFAWFQDLSEGTRNAIVVLGTVSAVVGLVGGAALVAAPKINALSVSLGEMGTKTAGRASRALSGLSNLMLGPWGAAVGAAVAVFGMFVAQQAEARAKTEQLTDTLDRQTGAVTEGTRAFLANELQLTGAFDTAEKLGISQADLVDAILSGNDAIILQNSRVLELSENVSDLSSEDKALLQSSQELRFQILDLNGTYGEATEASENRRAAMEIEGSATEDVSGANQVLAETLGITTDSAVEAADAFSDLDEKVRALIDSAFALNGAQRDVEAGIDAVTEALEENGATLDRGTEAGRENESVIEEQIAAIAQLAVTTAEQTGSAEEANAVLDEQTAALRRVLQQAGFTEEQIDDYIGVLDSVPDQINTAVRTSGVNAAVKQAQRVAAWLESIDRTVTISFQYENFMPRGGVAIPKKDGGIVGYANGGLPSFPNGGMFKGRGGPRDDANLVAISDGEFIVNARDTARHRSLLEAINSGRIPLSGKSRPALGRRFSGSGSENVVTIKFDTAGVSTSALARALSEVVYVHGGGNVQNAFGTR
jgi:TP901 family phage tail tape measure protein